MNNTIVSQLVKYTWPCYSNIKPANKVNVKLQLYMRALFEVNLGKNFLDSQATFR